MPNPTSHQHTNIILNISCLILIIRPNRQDTDTVSMVKIAFLLLWVGHYHRRRFQYRIQYAGLGVILLSDVSWWDMGTDILFGANCCRFTKSGSPS